MLKHVHAGTPEELLAAIESIGPHTRIVSIYGMHHTHWAWVEVTQPKEKKKGN